MKLVRDLVRELDKHVIDYKKVRFVPTIAHSISLIPMGTVYMLILNLTGVSLSVTKDL